MKSYVLIWNIKDYPDCGGGTECDFFDNLKQVIEKVNELAQDDRVTISFCGEIRKEIKFKAVERVTTWEIDG